MFVINSTIEGVHIARAAGTIYNPGSDAVIARVAPGRGLLGGVVFQGYNGASIAMHVAAFDPHWINRTFIWMVFNYAFIQLNCSVVLCVIKSMDHRVIDFAQKIGFKQECTLVGAAPGGDLLLHSMHKSECRWLTPPKAVEKVLSNGVV